MSALCRLRSKRFALAVLCCLWSSNVIAGAGYFDRISLRLAGAHGSPQDGVVRETVLAELSGQWSLGSGWVLEGGGGEQWDQFSQAADNEEVSVDARYGWLGVRLVVLSERSFLASAAVRRYRGRMLVDDSERLRLGYDWGELGLHWVPDRGVLSFSSTIRNYWWANEDNLWVVAGELTTQQRPIAFGLELESAIDRSEFQVGGSIHYRF